MGQAIDIRVAANGRMVLPKSVRETLGVAKGGAVILSVVDGEVKLHSLQQSLAHARELYRRYAKPDYSVDEFLKDRRDETVREGLD